jgi:cell division protein ZapA (FtsZ GTPase activity inhibitor)
MTEKKSVTVTIYKNEYTLKGEAESQQIIDLAKYVDARMTEMGRKSSAPADKIAILVSMNIADELHRLEKTNVENLKLIEHLEKSLEEIKATSDTTIKNASIQNEETEKLREHISEEKQKLQAAHQLKSQADKLIEELKNRMETLTAEMVTLKASFNSTQNTAHELQTALDQEKKKTDATEIEVMNLKHECETLESDLTEAREALEKAQESPAPPLTSNNSEAVSDEKLRDLIQKIEAVLE